MSAKVTRSGDLESAIAKADSLAKTEFTANVERSIEAVFKMGDDFLIWGPASVEIVDKEDDRVSAKALESALPQLLKRARLSYQHTDQIVGRILKEFETEGAVEVTIDGKTYQRKQFPTDVLDLDDQNPALFVAGEVYDDSEQTQDVRRRIENGEINSYSISGEALTTQKQVQNGEVFEDILEMDLSAITVCEEGMNQEAKFAKVTGDSVDVSEIRPADPDEVAKAEPQWSVSSGSIADPNDAKKAISKAMSNGDSNSGDDPEQKSGGIDSIDGDIATKSFVDEQLSKTEQDLLDKAGQRAANEIEKQLPGGDLATVDAVESIVDARVKGSVKGDDMDHGEEDEDEDYEDKGDGEGHDYESDEEMEEDESHEGDGEKISHAELKDQLPADVFDVVSDYIGDTKAEKDDESVEKGTVEQVEELLKSAAGGEAGIDLGDRADEIDQITQEESDEQSVEKGEDIEMGESPALANFDY